MNILYIGNNPSRIESGADTVNKRNIFFLQQLVQGKLDIIPLLSNNRFIDKVLLYLGGLTLEYENRIIRQLRCKEYDYVFISQSLLGKLSKKLKKKFPNIKLICCYHNIEKQYASEFMQVSGWQHFPFYLAAIYNEFLSVKYCDYSLVLNQRDAELFFKIYNKKVSCILPVAYEDLFEESRSLKVTVAQSAIKYLFVGVDFFANVEGIRWFILNVLPFIPGRLVIAGKGMDNYREEWMSERVEVLGYVKDLADLYYKSTFVILPILSGGGMKTKTAEALMYGKTIIGTKEAFEGYLIDSEATVLCDSAEDFIDTINRLIKSGNTKTLNLKSRQLFIENYSYDAVCQEFYSLIK